MASLQNAQIDQTYPALLKVGDNGPVTAALKAITDGAGAATNIQMSNTATNFVSGTVDFTGATVSGLPVAVAGLVVGTGTDALQNAIGTASTASGAASIALGKNSTASGGQSMAYGEEALASATSAAAFGQYAEATNFYAIAFGRTSSASGDGAVAFGQQTSAAQSGAVAMGRQVTSDTADTTHVRALKIVAPDGAALGGNGITLLSTDGTDGVVTLLDSDELALDGEAILRQTNAYATGGQQSSMSGYGSTYWSACSLMTGRPGLDGAFIDQSANRAIVTKFDIDYTKTVTTIGVPMPVVSVSENLYLAVYESASNGGPGVRVWQETKAITSADNDTWVEVTLASPWTPEKGKSYWIGAMTPTGNSGAALARMGGEHASCQRFSTTNNASTGTIIAIHSLTASTGGTAMPTDFSAQSFGHRDEKVFFAWK